MDKSWQVLERTTRDGPPRVLHTHLSAHEAQATAAQLRHLHPERAYSTQAAAPPPECSPARGVTALQAGWERGLALEADRDTLWLAQRGLEVQIRARTHERDALEQERDGYRAGLVVALKNAGAWEMLETLVSLSAARDYGAAQAGADRPWLPIGMRLLEAALGKQTVAWRWPLLTDAGLIAWQDGGHVPTALGAALIAAQGLDSPPE